ncbi:translation initiation factor Sui1 [Congregibacter litoralis]
MFMSRGAQGKSRTVYSTDKGRLCPDCGVVKADCRCRLLKAAAPAGDGVVRIKRETKGRGGKAVTLVTGLPDDAATLKKRAKVLKQRCGVGGAIKDGVIEIQGDQREIIKSMLEAEGLTVKLAGG